MGKKLKDDFPLIQTRQEVLERIEGNKELKTLFSSWKKKHQEEFLDYCTGARGVKILYDSFFKYVFNPDCHRERLNTLLSILLKKKVKVQEVLQNEHIQVAAEHSLLIMDIVVQMEDGSIANVEVQKIGYQFPGQRAACYSADLLLRQYKRMKDLAQDNDKKFSYKSIKTVYTIVFFEQSPEEFKKYPGEYLHHFESQSDTGIKLELLQKYLFIPLDIFRKITENGCIKNEVEAWLTFLSTDEPERITSLIAEYPKFKPMYEDIYRLCRNTEEVMKMFSEELAILDKNTVEYMIDEMQEELDKKDSVIAELTESARQLKEQEQRSAKALQAKDDELAKQESEIKKLREELERLKNL